MSPKISVMGRLGADPKSFNTQEGKAFVVFRMAVDTFEKKTRGTQWFNVTVFDGISNGVVSKLKTGSLVSVGGTLRLGVFQKKDGGCDVDASINADYVEFGPSLGENAKENAGESAAPVQQAAPATAQAIPTASAAFNPTPAPSAAPYEAQAPAFPASSEGDPDLPF